jgi:hypothetical protein
MELFHFFLEYALLCFINLILLIFFIDLKEFDKHLDSVPYIL